MPWQARRIQLALRPREGRLSNSPISARHTALQVLGQRGSPAVAQSEMLELVNMSSNIGTGPWGTDRRTRDADPALRGAALMHLPGLFLV